MMKYQDIHTTDSALWKQYQDYMAKGEYDAAKAILAQTQLDNKRIDASLFNAITTELTRLQNQGKDSTWSKNTMAVQAEPPANMQAGECYCKINYPISPYWLDINIGQNCSVNGVSGTFNGKTTGPITGAMCSHEVIPTSGVPKQIIVDVKILYNGEQIAFNSNTNFDARTYARVTTNMVFNSYKIKANTSTRNIENTNYLYHVERTLDISDDN